MRYTQIKLFDTQEPGEKRGGVTCSSDHTKPKKAVYRVFFKNGVCREFCASCAKKAKAGRMATRIDHIEKIN